MRSSMAQSSFHVFTWPKSRLDSYPELPDAALRRVAVSAGERAEKPSDGTSDVIAGSVSSSGVVAVVLVVTARSVGIV